MFFFFKTAKTKTYIFLLPSPRQKKYYIYVCGRCRFLWLMSIIFNRTIKTKRKSRHVTRHRTLQYIIVRFTKTTPPPPTNYPHKETKYGSTDEFIDGARATLDRTAGRAYCAWRTGASTWALSRRYAHAKTNMGRTRAPNVDCTAT